MSDLRFDEGALARWSSVRAWREDSDAIIDRLVVAWDLTLGQEFGGGVAGRAFAAETPDGHGVVLKVGFPHPEAIAEAVAIDAWAPRYAPRLLAVDAPAWAMVLERVLPGTPLSTSDYPPELAFSLACEALAVAHRTTPPPSIPGLAEVIGDWPNNARRMISARAARDRARILPWLERADQLIADDDGTALLHGDINPGNVLEGPRELVLIDPKPMRGRVEFDPAPLVEQIAPCTPEIFAARVRRAADLLDADPRLVVAWGAVRAALNVAWAWDDGNSGAPELRTLAAWEALSAA